MSTWTQTKRKHIAALFRLRNASTGSTGQPGFTFPDSRPTDSPSPYPFWVDRNNLLEELGNKYQPSKRNHNYLVYYWMHFRDIRTHVKKVLEIGVQTDRCLKMWEEFFPNATIYGVDIEPSCKAFDGGRRRMLIGNQGSREFCRELVSETGGQFDIIIDDGSHKVEHQLNTFNWLFPELNQHGIYVIEDTGGVVGDTGLETVGNLQALVNHIMHWPAGYDPGNWGYLSSFDDSTLWADRNIVGVAFYRWIAFVMRGNNPGDNPYLHAGPPRN